MTFLCFYQKRQNFLDDDGDVKWKKEELFFDWKDVVITDTGSDERKRGKARQLSRGKGERLGSEGQSYPIKYCSHSS